MVSFLIKNWIVIQIIGISAAKASWIISNHKTISSSVHKDICMCFERACERELVNEQNAVEAEEYLCAHESVSLEWKTYCPWRVPVMSSGYLPTVKSTALEILHLIYLYVYLFLKKWVWISYIDTVIKEEYFQACRLIQ